MGEWSPTLMVGKRRQERWDQTRSLLGAFRGRKRAGRLVTQAWAALLGKRVVVRDSATGFHFQYGLVPKQRQRVANSIVTLDAHALQLFVALPEMGFLALRLARQALLPLIPAVLAPISAILEAQAILICHSLILVGHLFHELLLFTASARLMVR